MRTRCWVVAVILLLALPLAARAQPEVKTKEVKVSGRVVDSAGKPVAAANVSFYWQRKIDGEMKHAPDRVGFPPGATTDAEGRFTLTVPFRTPPKKEKLLALDKDRKRGGLIWLEERSADQPVEIKLGPLVHVHGQALGKHLNKRPPWMNVIIYTGQLPLLICYSTDSSFSFRLPPGVYQLRLYARDCQRVEKELTLTADMPDVDLKTLDLPPTVLSKFVDKPPPKWHVTDARGVPKEVQLTDFKGKWVLVEFWAHWCGPCVVRSLPKLIDLYEERQKDRDKFQILAFHVASAKDPSVRFCRTAVASSSCSIRSCDFTVDRRSKNAVAASPFLP